MRSRSRLALLLAVLSTPSALRIGTPTLRRAAAARSHTFLAVETSPPATRTGKRCKRPGPNPVVPTLREVDLLMLDEGKRVQRQDLKGGGGSGFAVQDIRADPATVWRCISDFTSYDRLISTVRTAQAYSPTLVIPGTGCYRFTVSRLRLCLDVRFCVDDEQRYAYWSLEQPSWVSGAASAPAHGPTRARRGSFLSRDRTSPALRLRQWGVSSRGFACLVKRTLPTFGLVRSCPNRCSAALRCSRTRPGFGTSSRSSPSRATSASGSAPPSCSRRWCPAL